MDWTNFCNNLKEILELERYKDSSYVKWEIDDTNIKINCEFSKDKVMEFSYTKRKFVSDFKNISEDKELNISNEKYYEIPISFKNGHLPVMSKYYKMSGKDYKDNENNITYKMDAPSQQFWLKIIELKTKPNTFMTFTRLFIFENDFKFKDGIGKKSLFDLLAMVYKNYITLKIHSASAYKKQHFQDLADAFIFNINYNTDIGIRQMYELENIQEIKKNTRFRSESMDRISAPRRIYKKELVEQYNMANISEDPFIKYLCYYHILEHFYESVYKEELVKIVKNQLTLPDFSIKKEKEIIKLIDLIKEKVKMDREYFDGNELEALELVIKKYIDIDTLKDKIESIDSDLVDYYNKERVAFSHGIPINFSDKDNLYKNISKRIYFTRNALVHYKSNDLVQKEKGIYRPFKDREELLKEVPLIRILAEDVIIKDSEII